MVTLKCRRSLEGLIDHPEIWFDFLKKRNMTMHTYNEQEADEVIAICPSFSSALKKFFEYIGAKYD
jgi:Fe-S oxidoreductase